MPLPVANFEADKTIIPVGASVTFTDLSLNDPEDWSWLFIGGTPSIVDYYDSSRIPVITYYTPGVYTVQLAVSNKTGLNDIIKTNYITVNPIVQPVSTAPYKKPKINKFKGGGWLVKFSQKFGFIPATSKPK